MGKERERRPRGSELIFEVEDRAKALEVGARLEEGFSPEVWTGLSFLLRADGRTFVVACFDPAASPSQVASAKHLLTEFGERSWLTLSKLWDRRQELEISEFYLGDGYRLFSAAEKLRVEV